MNEPAKAFEIASGSTPLTLGIIIGSVVIVALLLTGAWAWLSHYKGFANGTISGQGLANLIIRFILLLVIMLFLIRYTTH